MIYVWSLVACGAYYEKSSRNRRNANAIVDVCFLLKIDESQFSCGAEEDATINIDMANYYSNVFVYRTIKSV